MTHQPEAPRGRRFLPELVLILVTLFWGGTFLAVQVGLRYAGPLFLVGLRFAIAALLILAADPRQLGRMSRVEVAAGLWVGIGMTGGYLTQTIGLLHIASSKSAFITAAYVPLVPLLELAIFRTMPRAMMWLGIAMAFVGLVLLAGPGEIRALRLGTGELLTIASAIFTAVQIVQIGRYARRVDARRVALLQTGLTSLACFAAMLLTGEPLPAFSWPLAAVVGTLSIGTALVQVAMYWAQRSIAATRATLIYAGEPVYAGIVGRVAGERLPGLAILGGILVVTSVIVSELRIGRRRED